MRVAIENQLKRPLVVERMPAVPHTLHAPGITIVRVLDQYDLSWEFIYFAHKKGQGTIIFPRDRQVTLGEKLINQELTTPGAYDKLMREWRIKEKEFNQICDTLERTSWRNLSLKKLKELYADLFNKYCLVWAIPLTANNISCYVDEKVIPQIKKIDDFIVLCTPQEESEMKKEEKDLLEIALGNKDSKVTQSKLKEHAQKYHWITNTYREAVKLTPAYFRKKMREIKNPLEKLARMREEESRRKKKQTALLKEGGFSQKELTVAHLASQATILHDLRKKYNLIGNYYLFQFLKEFSKRTNYPEKELAFTIYDEMVNILEGKEISHEKLKSRQQCCVELIERDSLKILGGEEAEKLYELIEKADSPKGEIKEFSGMIASPGKVQGVARIITDVSKAKKFNPGDILVTSMTRPEFVPLMKKAAAVVTNEGGITCHAAIVSRELGIPCIIGTKIATKVLKEGDIVEVDGNKGIIRRLKK